MTAIALSMAISACGQAPPAAEAPIRLPPGLSATDYPPLGWTWAPVPGMAGRRYGVSGPATATRAQVLIVPARAPAQAWFGVANRLIERGYTVWLLDPLPAPPDGAEVRTMIDKVVRPNESRRLALLGEGEGAQAALAAGEKADLVLLWSPKLGAPPERLAAWAIKLGLGNRHDPRLRGWREGEPANDAVAAAWMAANPFLRPPIPSFEQQAQARKVALTAQAPETLARIKAPVHMLGGDAAAGAACRELTACTPLAPGVEATLGTLDALTAADTRSAPPVKKARST